MVDDGDLARFSARVFSEGIDPHHCFIYLFELNRYNRRTRGISREIRERNFIKLFAE